jgi:hypothetical protein
MTSARSMHETQSLPAADGPRSGKRGFVAARTVGSFVPKLTRKAFEKYGFSAAALLTDWAVIVGKDLASYTAPERLKWPRGVGVRDDIESGDEGRPGATLVLRVDPARALDVEYKGRQLIERINGYFGYRAIAEMRILQAPLTKPAVSRTATVAPPPPCAAPELASIADERLRAALGRLKSGLMARASAT